MPTPCKHLRIASTLVFLATKLTAKKDVCLLGCLNEIDDPRKHTNGTLHDFREILVISIAAMLSNSDTVEDIAYWARKKEAWLRRFLVLKNGVPSEETFLRFNLLLPPLSVPCSIRQLYDFSPSVKASR